MKIKDGFILKEFGGETVVVATGEASKSFYGMIKLNNTGKDIWEGLLKGLSEDEIISLMADKYHQDFKEVESDVHEMIVEMDKAGFFVSE